MLVRNFLIIFYYFFLQFFFKNFFSFSDELDEEIRNYFENRLANLPSEKPFFVGFRNGPNLVAMLQISEDASGAMVGGITEKTTLLDLFGQVSGVSKRKELFMNQVCSAYSYFL